MNVLAIQDLSGVCRGGGSIQFPLQQLDTVVGWVRQATLRMCPPKGRPYRAYVTHGHMSITSNIVVTRFRYSQLIQGSTLNYDH